MSVPNAARLLLGRAPRSGARFFSVDARESDGHVVLLDQRALPAEEAYVVYDSAQGVADAIADMVVRGAPAIGIAAAYAMALAARRAPDEPESFEAHLAAIGRRLEGTRPTAVNLTWAVRRMFEVAKASGREARATRIARLAREACRIHEEDVAACRAIGAHGAERVPDGATILTHCNAGALATGGYGTALGVVRAAHEQDKRVRVLADETRPYLQGSRLTAWELAKDGIPVEILCDSMAAHFMRRGEVDLVVVGADRVAANGDVANKIGTYALACLARLHGIPFYVAAPESTIDRRCQTGAQIAIEERSSLEVTRLRSSGGDVHVDLAPEGVQARHPAFDVTPADLVSAIFTENGVFEGARQRLPPLTAMDADATRKKL
jgi:methylthioribose-1-phosphate isomerase